MANDETWPGSLEGFQLWADDDGARNGTGVWVTKTLGQNKFRLLNSSNREPALKPGLGTSSEYI